jgi:hypothetical protein
MSQEAKSIENSKMPKISIKKIGNDRANSTVPCDFICLLNIWLGGAVE